MFSSLVNVSKDVFTSKQLTLVTDVLTEASELLGSDVGSLMMHAQYAEALGLVADATYDDAIQAVVQAGDKSMARDLVKAVLALRHDERVQGTELNAAG